MSWCLSGTGGGGGGGYGFDLDIIIIKPPCSWSRTPQTSSSESSNSPLTISTRKPRTPRKRPNQTYNEAATLLSTAYPKLFSKPNNNLLFTKPKPQVFDTSFLLHRPIQQQNPKSVQSPATEISSRVNALELNNDHDDVDFDVESILDEEIQQGIDSIIGGRVQDDSNSNAAGASSHHHPWFQRTGVTALRHVHDGNWWNFPAVDILQISPKICGAGGKADKKKKKVVVVERPNKEDLPKSNTGLLLKLNYDDVRNAWSDRGKPFAEDSPVSDVPGNDVNARLSQIDLMVREASVQRYKEKRRTRLFSKKIRYQVRKVNADHRRPRKKVWPS